MIHQQNQLHCISLQVLHFNTIVQAKKYIIRYKFQTSLFTIEFKKLTENGTKTFNDSNNRNEYPDRVHHWSNYSRGYTGLFNLFID
ncbi:MAG: hypothetical protein H6Q18_899 [Bacteroidetes bacterium]|nr:hypothetical protein [Bacteroidota bacterium]